MYPSLPGFSGGRAAADGAARPPPPQQQQPVADASPWLADAPSVLRVKIADEYRLDPLVTVPPALEAGTRSQQRDLDFEFERKVMQQEGSGLVDRFLGKPEDTYYTGTKAGKYIAMGYTPAAVQLALAYSAQQARNDEAQVVDFCNNYTQLLGMGFSPAVAAGALVRTKNDVTAATDICLASTS